MSKNYKNTVWIWQFKAIHGAMTRLNTKFFHDGLLTSAVRIFCSSMLRTLGNHSSQRIGNRQGSIPHRISLSSMLHFLSSLYPPSPFYKVLDLSAGRLGSLMGRKAVNIFIKVTEYHIDLLQQGQLVPQLASHMLLQE